MAKKLKETYVDPLDVSRVAHDLRQGGCRKSSSERSWGEVGHCLVVGQSEEWGVGGCPGPAGVERCRHVPQRGGFRSIIHVIRRDEILGNCGRDVRKVG